jgi:hypothetical protein
MQDQILDHCRSIVVAIAGLTPGEWLRIVVNFEVEDSNNSPVSNVIAFSIEQFTDKVDHTPLELTSKIKNDFLLLRKMHASFEKAWDVCDLVIEPTGEYEFKYEYDGAKRLNSIFDDNSYDRFDRYLEEFIAGKV